MPTKVLRRHIVTCRTVLGGVKNFSREYIGGLNDDFTDCTKGSIVALINGVYPPPRRGHELP